MAGAASSPASPAVGARLEVISRPIGAQVEVDGRLLPGETPLQLPLPPGEARRVRVLLDRHRPWSGTVDLLPGEQRVLSVELVPQRGQLDVRSNPSGAEVLLDGLPIGTTPLRLEDLSLDEGPRLLLRRAGYQDLPVLLSWGGRTSLAVELGLTPLAAARPPRLAAPPRRPVPPAPRPPALLPRPPSPSVGPSAAGAAVGSSGLAPTRQEAAPFAGTGYLTVHALPWGRVVLDGKELGAETPMIRRPLPAGTHQVQVFFPSLGRLSTPRLVSLPPGQELKLLIEGR